MNTETLQTLKKRAKHIRADTIDMIGNLGVGHIGGSMSVVDILVLLYTCYMRVDSKNPRKRDRDRLILSKGHAGPALYSVLADEGFFPRDWLHTLNRGGTHLPSHVDMLRTPGVDMTAGSLGQGLSAAVGMCLGNRLDNIDSRVFVIISDGESNEGQIWEAAMAASQFRLNALVAFTDYNKMQIDGYQRDIMSIEDITAKWIAFGWAVQRVDGHDFSAMDYAIKCALKEKSRPSMIVLDTVKGKGATLAEGKPEAHNMKYDARQAEEMISSLLQEDA